MLKRIQLVLALLVLAGCGSSDDDDSGGLFSFNSQVREEFLPLDQYQYDDFDLSEDVLYWETRIGPALTAGFPVVYRHEFLFFYAQEQLAATFEDRLDDLAAITEPLSGFSDQCVPGSCLTYVAGIGSDELFTITTQQELAAFFGDIDTEAELAYWLWSEDYIPLDYLVEDSGFEVTVETNVRCEQRSRQRVFVDRNGVITPMEGLDSEGLETCNGADRQDQVLFGGDEGLRDGRSGPSQGGNQFIQPGSPGFDGEGLIIQSGDLRFREGGVTIQAGNVSPGSGGLVFQSGNVAPDADGPVFQSGNVAPDADGPVFQSGNVAPDADGPVFQSGNVAPDSRDPVFQGGTVPLPSQDLLPGEGSSTVLDSGIAGQGSSAQFGTGTLSGGDIVLQDRTESLPAGQTRFETE